ncbi:hypothetical protein DIPPA_17631 [Diplonema papillatum]|nr:hypothetical protein DIPPA_17631 [Diplonema papillatum]
MLALRHAHLPYDEAAAEAWLRLMDGVMRDRAMVPADAVPVLRQYFAATMSLIYNSRSQEGNQKRFNDAPLDDETFVSKACSEPLLESQ